MLKLNKNLFWRNFNHDNRLLIYRKRALVYLNLHVPLLYSSLSLDTGNARPVVVPSRPEQSLRVPPLKIKLPHPEKQIKPSVSIPPTDSKFQCLVKLDRINLSLYNISNLPNSSQIKNKKSNESLTTLDSINNKTKS